MLKTQNRLNSSGYNSSGYTSSGYNSSGADGLETQNRLNSNIDEPLRISPRGGLS